MVGSQDQGFGLLVVGVATGILASILFAVLALEAPFAIRGMAVAVKTFTAAMSAA